MSPRRILGTALLVWLAAVSATGSRVTAAAQQPAPRQSAPPSVDEHRALLKQYCVTCHNQRSKERGAVPVAFEQIDLASVGTHARELEAIVVKMRAGLMPPAASPRPPKEVHDRFVTWLEGSLDRLASAQPNPGRTEPFHRLNRAEYRNAVRDVLDLDIDVSSLLPADDASYGFDNIAGVLKMSPTLMERYLSAAQRVSRLAVGTAPPVPRIDYFRIADDLSQDSHLPGMPLGTRGGTKIPYVFPMDATYEVRVRLARDLNESMPLYTEAQVVDVLVDGERVGGFTLPGVTNQPAPPRAAPARPASPAGTATGSDAERPAAPAISQVTQAIRITAKEREARNNADEKWNLRVPIKAGQRELIVTFANRTSALDESVRLPFLRPYPAGVNINETRQGAHLWYVEVAGPYDPTGAGDSPSRRRVFSCTARTDACAKTILSRLARRAYRRPVTDADVQPLLAFYKEGGGSASFDAGIERAIRRLLVSPEFLDRVERDPAGVKPGQPYRISDLELASRLSFFLWISIPDDQLLNLAEKKQLGDPATIAAQV
jgi:hypothetical protein